MNHHVLVAYASKHGATAEIAEKIGAVLQEAGVAADVLPVQQVKELTPYTAVILGSAVYIGRWRKEAVRFLEANEQSLTARDVWIFSSGPTGEGETDALLQGWRLPQAQQPLVERIRPHDVAVFHGRLHPQDLNFIEKWMIKNVNSPVGDFRDWDSITAWATAVAQTITQKKAMIHE